MMGQHLDELKAKARAYDEEHWECVRLRKESASRDAEVAELQWNLAAMTSKWHESNRAWWAMEKRAREAEAELSRAGAALVKSQDQRDQARRELDAVRAANESVAVCAEHTSRVIGDGCLVCELDAVRERVREECRKATFVLGANILRALDGGDS